MNAHRNITTLMTPQSEKGEGAAALSQFEPAVCDLANASGILADMLDMMFAECRIENGPGASDSDLTLRMGREDFEKLGFMWSDVQSRSSKLRRQMVAALESTAE